MINVAKFILILSISLLQVDGDIPCSICYGVYISLLIRFARAISHVVDFNTRTKLLTQEPILKQGYQYNLLLKTFSKFYLRYYVLIPKFNIGLKSLLRQGLSEPKLKATKYIIKRKNTLASQTLDSMTAQT